MLCTDEGVRVTVPLHERNISTGAMPPDLSFDLATVLQVCGFVIVQGAMPPQFVRFLREQNNVSHYSYCAHTRWLDSLLLCDAVGHT